MTQPIPKDIFKPQASEHNNNRTVLILTADGTEDTEFFYPYYRLVEEGCTVHVATPKGGAFKGKNGSGLADTRAISEVDTSVYELLYIPGGKAPAELKKEGRASEIVREFVAAGKPVAAICHGPQLLAEAGVIKGCTLSGWPEIEEEIRDAGASYVSEASITDRQFITGRWPGDLPAFMQDVLASIGLRARDQSPADEAALSASEAALARNNIAAA